MIITLAFFLIAGLVAWQLLKGSIVFVNFDRKKQPVPYWGSIGALGLLLFYLWGTGEPATRIPELSTAANNLTVLPTPAPSPTSNTCVVAAVDTYATTPSDPVLIGGGDFVGPQRISAYLQSLYGPNGQEINYLPLGQTFYQGVSLYSFSIGYSGGNDITIYIDTTRSGEPLAPQGFTCRGRFNLGP